MSDFIIKDGTGTGASAKVDKHNRLLVKSISEGFNVDSAIVGDNYNINTGAITLTSGNESAVAYFKNNEDNIFIVREILIILGSSTGGSGNLEVELLRNPTAGTIVSGASDMDTVVNRNFGNSQIIVADTYKGAEGNTFTDGETFANTIRTSTSLPISFDADVVVLKKGNSLGVNVTPQAGNTSMDVRVAIVGFLFDANGDN